ncbi:MAG: hypothetical protein PHR68_05550 [Candidatus Gracilibacteria bacterium]|nr:hypothetical protein [Candidatus Gracilibacteria bacterium]
MKLEIQKQIKINVKKFIKNYYHFFDKTLENSTITVGIIGLFIFSVGISFGGINNKIDLGTMKTNIIEAKNISYNISVNKEMLDAKIGFVTIGGKKYKILFEEIEKKSDETSNINNSSF